MAVTAGVVDGAVVRPLRVKSVSAGALRQTTLENGIIVLSEYMPHVRSVAFGAWVRSASVHETHDKMGVSHLLEHMVFKGTARRSVREIALSLEVLGSSLDAYTSREHTVFQTRVLDEHLHQAADVIGDLISAPALRDSDLDLERHVVLEEIGMSEDVPDDLVFELHNETLWEGHPLAQPILGTRESVGALTVNDLRALHDRAYRPEHIVVSAAGHVEHERLVDVLRESGWDKLQRGSSAIPVVPPAIRPKARRRHVERDITQTHVVLGGESPKYGDPRRHAMTLLTVILGGGMSSRLFQRVREERGLAYSIYAYNGAMAAAGSHGVYFATSPGTVNEALDAVLVELGSAVKGGITQAELDAGKGQLKGQLTLSLESPSARMYRCAYPILYGEPFRELDEMLALIDRISLDDVQAVASEFLVAEQQTVVSLGPASASAI